MLFADVAEVSKLVGSRRGRNFKIDALAACLSDLRGELAEIVVGFMTGSIRQGRIGVGPSALRAIDVPPAAEPSLDVVEVDRRLSDIAAIAGKGSVARRRQALGQLLSRATADEQRMLRRLILGELRQGAAEGVFVSAIARAAEVPEDRVRRALMISGELGAVTLAALERGAAGLSNFSVQLFTPLRPMLAQPADDLGEVLQGDAALLELKLDGARVQVHRAGDEVRVYSRRLRDVTPAVPELVRWALAAPADRFIVDGEAICLREDGTPHPFQTTMRRFGRRGSSAVMQRELPLSGMLFDCLLLGDDELVDRPLEQRLETLDSFAHESVRIPRAVVDDPERGEELWQRAITSGHEGLMAKDLSSSYEAGNRGKAWRKLKPHHTLDLVVTAAEWGSGRRRGWLSNLHLAARSPGGPVMVGKTFKGLTDELLVWQTRELLARETHRDEYTVYVRPELVVEVAISGVQDSPQYPGGVALRFARVRRYRDDKTPADADTIEMVAALAPGMGSEAAT